MRTIFWSENLKEGNQFEDLYVDDRIILKRILNKQEWNVVGLIHLT
jgi:hypothetical protein